MSPSEAKLLDIETNTPLFVLPRSQEQPLIVRIGSVLEDKSSEGELRRITTFPKLEEAILSEAVIGRRSYFTGFVAFGEAKGEFDFKVLGIKAFIDESEVRQGYLKLIDRRYIKGSDLHMVTKFHVPVGRENYAFRVTQSGKVLFSNPIMYGRR